jgi:hypothetical protein
MRKNPFFGTVLLPALLLMASCQKEIRNGTAEDNQPTQEENTVTKRGGPPAVSENSQTDLLKSLRQATARFHSTTQAIKAGYEPDDHCVSVPGLGGMGYHWVNPLLVDAVFNLQKPEVVLYASGPGGKLRLVAVEYIVLKTPGQARPMFGSHPFDDGGTPIPAPHWSLHVWLYENNPSGIFTPFNPNITCP